jgi:hypothetical protein
MLGMQEREEEANRDGLDALGAERFDQGGDFFHLQGDQDLAVVVHALRDFQAAVGRNQRWRPVGEEVVDVGAHLAPDGEDIPEAAGGDQCGAGSFALQKGVGRHGGAVDHRWTSVRRQSG